MRIRTLLRTSVAFGILTAALLTVVSWFNAEERSRINDSHEHALLAAREVSDLLGLTSEYILNNEARALRQWRSRHAMLVTLLEKDAAIAVPTSVLSEAKSLEDIFQRLVDTGAGRSDLQDRQRALLVDQLQIKSQILTDMIDNWSAEATKAYRKAEYRSSLLAVVTPVLVLMILLLLAFLLFRRVLNPMERLHQEVMAASGGNLTGFSATSANDELGELSRAFDKMAVKMVSELRQEIAVRETLELHLKRTNADLEQFAYVASHDLRQPLRMVNNYLQVIEKQLETQLSDDLKSYFNFAVDGARRMDRLIVDLLEYSRTGRSAETEPVQLGKAVAQALLILTEAIREAKAKVSVAEQLPMVSGNETELVRLFQNLIGNAIKYRSPDQSPRIEVGWRKQADEYLLWIKDNGMGILPEQHEKAFMIFQRLVARDSHEGSGIGLAICKKIVEHHGGRIWIDSGPGPGCTFLMTFPVPPMTQAIA